MRRKPWVKNRRGMKFSHVKPGDKVISSRGGLRDFFLYRDLGIADATNGKVIAHLVKANKPPQDGTGSITMSAIFRSW